MIFLKYLLVNQKYFYLRVNNGTDIRIIGNGYKVNISKTTFNIDGSLLLAFGQNNKITFENFGVITNDILLQGNGGFVTPRNAFNTFIFKSCYYFSDITASEAGGFYGRTTSGLFKFNNIYFWNCYVIGDITGTDSGGFVGKEFNKDGFGFFFNCYFIGNIGSNSYTLGYADTFTNNSLYVYNWYSNPDGNIFPTTSKVYYNNIYLYNNNWNDSDANSNLSTSAVNINNIANSQNWIEYNTTPYSSTTFTNATTLVGINDGDPTMFSFSTNTPYGINSFLLTPFLAEFYTIATDEASNCICKGTKITVINEQGEEEYHNIEEMKPGMIVLTPKGNHKKVLQVMKQVLVKKRKLKNSPCKIPKDFFEKNVPFDDIYCSGNHSFLFTDEEIKKYGLEDMNFSIKNNLKSIFTFRFGMEEIFEKVCALKSDHPYQLNYYHLLIEDGEGFYTNNLSSESLDIQFKDHFEEINNDN